MRIGHSYHLVEVSPWPITTGISIFSIIIGINSFIQNKTLGKELFYLSFFALIYSLFYWGKDIIIEGLFLGQHTQKVEKGLIMGFILFVISEVFVFFGLFFCYFYNSLIPAIDCGNLWPPVGIISLDWKSIPLLNTLILLTSGITITACHNFILNSNYSKSLFYLLLTILLGFIFILFQYFEYFNCSFTIADSVFGSSFFLLTGCHGLHILIGTSLLFFTLLRFPHFTSKHHLLFTSSAIYWHFLDAVWLALYFILYCWAY